MNHKTKEHLYYQINKMIDLAIISLPRLDLTRPAIAPAILSSLANQKGVKNKVFDFVSSPIKS